jgi:multicomponent Na+:H+ antiporter subunit D
VGLLTLFSMTKIWGEVFWKDAPAPASGDVLSASARLSWRTAPLWLPSLVLAGATVAIGLGAEWAYRLAHDAALQLLDRQGYIDAVLGGS